MAECDWIYPPEDSPCILTVCAECGAVVDLAYHGLHERWHEAGSYPSSG